MYKPIQITKDIAMYKSANYFEISPCKELQKYVSCFWVMISRNDVEIDIQHRVLPDGCIDIIFDFLDSTSNIIGIMKNPGLVPIKTPIDFLGVRFLPRAIPFLLKGEAKHFTDNALNFKDVFYKNESLLQNVLSLSNLSKRIKTIETELIFLFKDYNIDARFKNVMNKILFDNGKVSVKNLSEYFFLSERQLSRDFNKHLGVSTKEFIQIIRFQSTLKYMINFKPDYINWSTLSIEQGYYDQAHFIKDFKKMYGKTPENIFL